MNICFVNSYYSPWVGGAESYVKNLATALSIRGHQVTVYCSERPLNAGLSYDNRIKVIRMHTPLLLYGTPLVLFPPSIISEEYDIIHANFPSPYLASISSFISEVAATPSVLTWHNDLPPVTSGAKILVNLHNSLAPIYLRYFDRIIATTDAYARKSEILRRFMSKVTVVNNGVDTKRFSPHVSGEKIRERYKLDQNKVALFVGALTTFHTYKGVDILLRAFSSAAKLCKEARLLVVGGGNFLEAYRKQASDLGISGLVVFAGHVSDDDLPQYYAASDLAVLPSKDSSEGFGLVLVEAMACGKAVIGSKVGGIGDVITDGVNGLLVQPKDVNELSRAMIHLFENGELRTRMGLAGVEFSKLHDWSIVAKSMEAIYDQIQDRST